MEQLEASADALVSDRVALAFFGAPYWVWLMIGFCLGALTLWTYWRCYLDEARRDPSLIGFWPRLPAPRDAERAGGGAEDDASQERVLQETILREGAGDHRGEAPALGRETSGAALRYRNWALETRLRQALDAAAEDAPLDVAALTQGLEDVLITGVAPGDDATPPEEISILKHRIWTLQNQLAERGAAFPAPAPQPSPPMTAPPPAPPDDHRARMAERLLVATRLGDWRLVRRVERELAEGVDPAPEEGGAADALLVRLAALEAERDSLADSASSLRYRRWLLSRRLGDAVEAARLDQGLSVDALLADLGRDGEAPRYGESGANAFLTGRAAPPAAPLPTPAPAADRSREIEALRRRAEALEAALRRERAREEPGPAVAATHEAASARYRLWLAQAELRRGFEPVAPPPPDTAGLAAAQEEAERLRGLLAQAEEGLRRHRGEAEAELARLRARIAELEAALERERRSAAAAQAEAQSFAGAAPSAAALADAEAARAELASAQERIAGLRSELLIAERALEDRRADAERLVALEAEVAELRRGALMRPELMAEIDGLRAQLRRYEAEAAERSAEAYAPRWRLEERAPPPPEPAPRANFMSAQRSVPTARSTDAETRASLHAALAPTLASPRRGVEAAALELIESGRVVGVDSNRPANLRDVAFPGEPDDLGVLIGATPELRAAMNKAGLFSFRQIAEFGAYDLAWLDDLLGLGGGVVRERWAPQAAQLATWRRDGRLSYGAGGATVWRGDGTLGAAEGATELLEPALLRAIAEEAARPRPAHPLSIAIEAPLTGAEAAALDLLQRPETPEEAERLPASFSREPFEPGDSLDDLQALRGVGPAAEQALRILGVGRYRQIASLTPEEAAWLDRRMRLGGRSLRERWLPQAQRLAVRAEASRRAAYEAQRDVAADTLARRSVPAAASPPPTRSAPLASARPPAPGPVADAALSAESAPEEAEAASLIAQGAASGAYEDRPGSARPEPEDEGDDLKAIKGVGAKQEAQLKAFGFHSFAQLAAFGPRDLAWLDAALGLRGRVVAEGWMRQARRLAERKEAGELRLGPEGTWTLPDPSSDRVAAMEAAMRSPLSPIEREAMRLIDAGKMDTVFGAAEHRPTGLLARPAGASPDPLEEIHGVNATLAELLNDLGVFYFGQLAAFGAHDLAWLDAKLRFNGRVVRDRWAAQAEALERLKMQGGL